jgi:hypothetical protein
MTDIREGNRTTTNSGKTPVGDKPQVEVYDTGTTNASTTTANGVTRYSTITSAPAYDTTVRRDVAPVESGPNWGGIILGLLVVLALIILLIWLL